MSKCKFRKGCQRQGKIFLSVGFCTEPEQTPVNEKRIRRLMRLMGLMPIYQKPNTSKAAKGHKIYPYLLRGLRVDRPNQVWCADITYPRLGFHMASVNGVEVHPGDSVYEDIRLYSDGMGVSGLSVVGLMMKAGAADMHFPSLDELSEVGAVTWCQRMAC